MNTQEAAIDLATRTKLAHILRHYAQGILTDSLADRATL